MSIPILVDDIIRFTLTTNDASGGAIAPSAPFVASDFKIYKDGSATQKVTTNGITVSSPFDTIIGLHQIEIDTSNDTGDIGFWNQESSYIVILDPSGKTVDSQSVVSEIGRFSTISDTQTSALYQGKVWFDSTAANTNSRFGVDGVPTKKVSSDTALLSLVTEIGTALVNIEGVITLNNNWNNKATFEGNDLNSTILLNTQDAADNVFRSVAVGGGFLAASENTVFSNCLIFNMDNFGGVARNCVYDGINDIADLTAFRPFLDYQGSSLGSPVDFNMNGPGRKAKFFGWFGDMLVTNINTMSGDLEVVIAGGKVTLDATCTSGNVKVSGFGTFVDNSTGTTVNQAGLGLQHWTGLNLIGTGANMVEEDGGGNKKWTAKALEEGPDSPGGDATLANQTLILSDTNAIKVKTDNLPGTIKKNTAFNNYTFVMLDETTEAPATGLTVTPQRSVDGAAFASMTNAVSEISAGAYRINISADDTNGNYCMWKFTAPGAKVAFTGFTTET